MIRVLVVDDHELVRSGITRMLADNPDIDVIGEASSGEDAIDSVRKDSPDIVLMDIRMPGIGGLEATRRILRIGDARDEDGELSLFDRLSEREMQIAMMVVDCQKVQDISDKLCLSPKTVNSYRYRIFEKLEISSDVELALMAVRLGLLDADKV